jgi:hypothetical protein
MAKVRYEKANRVIRDLTLPTRRASRRDSGHCEERSNEAIPTKLRPIAETAGPALPSLRRSVTQA